MELIIVVAIIALLAAATFVAVNPAKRIGNAQNAQRWSDITAIADAWTNYVADNNGSTPTSSADCISRNEPCMIANYGGTDLDTGCAATTITAGTSGGRIWLDPLVSSGYVGKIPHDPKSTSATATSTGYYMAYQLATSSGILVVGSCETYNSQTIRVIR